MLAHRIDASLPFVKQEAVTVLTASYATTDAAVQGIAKGMEDFYDAKYPEEAKAKQLELRSAVTEVQQIFKRTAFPEMKLNWQTHPNNLGHYYTTSADASAATTGSMSAPPAR
jgi:hypothetical protein